MEELDRKFFAEGFQKRGDPRCQRSWRALARRIRNGSMERMTMRSTRTSLRMPSVLGVSSKWSVLGCAKPVKDGGSGRELTIDCGH